MTKSLLFRDARDPGNFESAERGTTAPGKRVVRRRVLRATNGVIQRASKDPALVLLMRHYTGASSVKDSRLRDVVGGRDVCNGRGAKLRPEEPSPGRYHDNNRLRRHVDPMTCRGPTDSPRNCQQLVMQSSTEI